MDTLPSKRRKLSTTNSVTVDASDINRPGSRGGRRPAHGASYLSPTKSSLARFNSNLLSSSKSKVHKLGSQSRFVQEHHNEQDRSVRHQSLNPTPLRNATAQETFGFRYSTRERASTVSPSRSGQFIGFAVDNGIEHPSQTHAESFPDYSTTVVPASPPQEAQEHEAEAQNIVSDQLEHELQEIAVQSTLDCSLPLEEAPVGQDVESGEPELPPTPSQLGLEEPSAPPTGLLFSSPTRRARRKRTTAAKSSPLRPQETRSTPVDSQTQDSQVQTEIESALSPEDQQDGLDVLAKQATYDELLLQLKGVQGDVRLLERELGRGVGSSSVNTRSQEEAEELLEIITSTNPSHKPLPPPPKPPSISTRLSLLLPFYRPPRPTPLISQIPTEFPPFHDPIKLEDPLPYLQAFTPLDISSLDRLLIPPAGDTPLLQQQDIALRSLDELLHVKLRLVFNTVTEAVDSLSLTEISSWAEPELSDWIRQQAPTGDITSIGWACGRYWEASCFRAECWDKCYQKYSKLLQGQGLHGSEENDAKNKVQPHAAASDAGNTSPQDEADLPPPDESQPAPSRRTLALLLGRQSLLFTRAGVSLLIKWQMTFDWTGEVEDQVSVATEFPASWRSTDKRGSLDRIPELFENLVADKGIIESLNVIVRLLFPD